MYQGDTLGFSPGAQGLWAAPSSPPPLQIVREPPRPAHSGLVRGSSPAMQRVYEMIERVAPDRRHRADRRRERLRARSWWPNHPPGSTRPAAAFRGGELRSHPGYPDRGRIVRLREGRVHRCRPHPPGLLRARRGRHPVPGRDHRDVAGDAGAAAARARKRQLLPRRAATRRSAPKCASSRRPTAIPPRAVADNRLREDLMYRLAVFPITLPPLRSPRRGRRAARPALPGRTERRGRHRARLFAEALGRCCCAHPWPGNVRELKNCVQRAFILADAQVELQHVLTPANRAGP